MRVFKQIQPYLTYTDMVQLEARGAVVENRLQESDERYLKLMQDHERQRQENALLAACVLAQSESEKQEAAARLREFYGIIQSTTDGRPYATRNLEVLDKFGGVNIHSRPKIISRRGSTEDGNKTGIHALGVFTVPEETGEEQEYYFIEGVPEGVERVELRNSKKKKRKNRGDKAAADADDDFD